MADMKQGGGKKNRKLGRKTKAPSHIRYNQIGKRLQNKARRVLRSSGKKEFDLYCREHQLNPQSLTDKWAAEAIRNSVPLSL